MTAGAARLERLRRLWEIYGPKHQPSYGPTMTVPDYLAEDGDEPPDIRRDDDVPALRLMKRVQFELRRARSLDGPVYEVHAEGMLVDRGPLR